MAGCRTGPRKASGTHHETRLGLGRLGGHGLSNWLRLRGGDEWQAAEQDRKKHQACLAKYAWDQ